MDIFAISTERKLKEDFFPCSRPAPATALAMMYYHLHRRNFVKGSDLRSHSGNVRKDHGFFCVFLGCSCLSVCSCVNELESGMCYVAGGGDYMRSFEHEDARGSEEAARCA